MNERILLVDDEPDILDMLQHFLNGQGYQVKKALGGEEAIEIFQADSFDLVITDIRMPGMDGLDLMLRLKEMDKDVEVIILTGYATLENAIMASDNLLFIK